MRLSTLITTLALTGGILGAGTTFVPAFAQGSSPAAAAQSNWMPIEQVQTRLEAAGYRDFSKIERDDGKYEVNAIDTEGRRVELKLDPVSGEILETEVKRRD